MGSGFPGPLSGRPWPHIQAFDWSARQVEHGHPCCRKQAGTSPASPVDLVMADSQVLRRLRRVAALAGYRYKVWFRSHRRQLFLRWRDGDIADQMADYRRSIESRDWSAALPKALALG